MNIDFSAEPLFSWYVVLLLVSGLAMVAIGVVNFGALSTGWRAFNAIAGVAFVCYGIYLGFLFQGGTYIIFFKAFILPVVLIVQFFRSLGNRGQASAPLTEQVPGAAAAPVADAVPTPAAAESKQG